MPSFSKHSLSKLAECDERLVAVMTFAIKVFDFKVIEAARSIEQQKENVKNGVSKTMESKHLYKPSHAVDIYPYPIYEYFFVNNPNLAQKKGIADYVNRFYFQAGVVLTCANHLGIKIRWGGDWNMNMNFQDQSFFDLPHFELV